MGRGLGEGQQPSPHQLKGLGSCELLQRGLGWNPTAQRFSTIFSTQIKHLVSRDTIIVLMDYHAAIGGKTPVPPPCVCPCQETFAFTSPRRPVFSNSPGLKQVAYKNWREMQQRVYYITWSSWSRLTEAATDRCLAWLASCMGQWQNWRVTQTYRSIRVLVQSCWRIWHLIWLKSICIH